MIIILYHTFYKSHLNKSHAGDYRQLDEKCQQGIWMTDAFTMPSMIVS